MVLACHFLLFLSLFGSEIFFCKSGEVPNRKSDVCLTVDGLQKAA